MNTLNFMFDDYIKYDNFKIKIPKISDIKEIGEETFNQYVIPFMVTKEMLTFINEDDKSKFKDFDLFFLCDKNYEPILKDKDGISFLDLLVKSLKFYIGEEIKVLKSQSAILVNKAGVIYRDNFDDIANIILKINHTKKFKVEKIPEFKNDRQKDVYEKITSGRKRKQEKETINLKTIINVVMHGGKSYISYNEVKNMSVWQLLNSYSAIMGIENFEYNYEQYLAGVDSKNLDLTHWVEKLKL